MNAEPTEQSESVDDYDSDGDGVADRPDTASAEALAAELYAPVEDMSARTESARAVINPDMTVTYSDYGTPVRVAEETVDEETGESATTWRDVDYTLVESESESGVWAPVAAPVDVTVSSNAADEAARVTFDDGSSIAVTFPGLPGTDGQRVGSGADSPLPAPEIEGGVATFPLEGYSGSVDLVVAMATTGVSTWLRINEELTSSELAAVQTQGITFGLETSNGSELLTTEAATSDNVLPDGVTMPSGGLVLTNADGELVGAAPEMQAWDESATDSNGIPTETVTLETSLDDVDADSSGSEADVSSYALTVTPPDAFLTQAGGDGEGTTGEGVEYPVVIDPQVEALTRMHDTWVRNGINTNNASDMKLVVGKHFDSGTNSAEAFLSFDTSPLVGQIVYYSGLELFQYEAGSCDDRTMYVHRVNRAWTEGATTWANRPGVVPSGFHTLDENAGRAGCPDVSTEFGAEDAYVTVEIPQITQAWADGEPNYGLRLATDASADHSYERRFCSSNTNQAFNVCQWIAYKPKLEVVYGPYDDDDTDIFAPEMTSTDPDVAPTEVAPTEGASFFSEDVATLECEPGVICLDVDVPEGQSVEPDPDGPQPGTQPLPGPMMRPGSTTGATLATGTTASRSRNDSVPAQCQSSTRPTTRWQIVNRKNACIHVQWKIVARQKGKIVGESNVHAIALVNLGSGGAVINSSLHTWVSYFWGVGLPQTSSATLYSCHQCSTTVTRPYKPVYQDWSGAWKTTSHVAQGDVTNTVSNAWTINFFNPVWANSPVRFDLRTQPHRCDNSFGGNLKAGCVFPARMPILNYSTSTHDQVVYHIRNAQQSGLPGGTGTRPLTRTKSKTVYDRNRRTACPTSVTSKRPNSSYDCDEYPFAATNQGAGSGGAARTFSSCRMAGTGTGTGTGSRGFSRCFVLRSQNRSAGAMIGNFYFRERVMDGENYIVGFTR